MQILQTAKDTDVTQKTKELCQAILDQPSFQAMKAKIDTFLADAGAQQQYEALGQQQQYLVHKQQQGVALSEEEIAEFEQARTALMANPVAAGFIEAQKGFNKLQDTLSTFVDKTFELGRVPTTDEVETEMNRGSGCCGGGGGGGCGCKG